MGVLGKEEFSGLGFHNNSSFCADGIVFPGDQALGIGRFTFQSDKDQESRQEQILEFTQYSSPLFLCFHHYIYGQKSKPIPQTLPAALRLTVEQELGLCLESWAVKGGR